MAKIDAWKMSPFLLGALKHIFSGAFAVGFRVESIQGQHAVWFGCLEFVGIPIWSPIYQMYLVGKSESNHVLIYDVMSYHIPQLHIITKNV